MTSIHLEPAVTPLPSTYPFRVAYDASAFLSWNGGKGKGVQLNNLLGNYTSQFIGLAPPGKNYAAHAIIQDGLARYQTWQQISLPMLLRKWRADFFLAPYNIAPLVIPKRTRLILVLHDLILLEKQFDPSDLRRKWNNKYRRFLIRQAVGRAEIVLTVSHYSRLQIEGRFPGVRVRVIPCRISASWFTSREVARPRDRRNCIVLVSGNAPHKNLDRALEGFALFVGKVDRRFSPHLRLVGLSDSEAMFRRKAEHLRIGDLVSVEPYLTEGELQNLYRGSRAAFIPSLMEGFGIPVLEAMASGTPVIASNTTSLPEVGGTAAAYFDPTDPRAMAETLAHVLTSDERQQEMIERGFIQARQFHPDAVNRQVSRFWETLACGVTPVDSPK
jgi:glycosyltransferase involved in cell wall biosynthesis